MHRVIKASEQVALITEAVAREVGRVLAGAPVAHAIVDAVMMATAARRDPTVILTRDVDAIRALAAGYPHARGGRVACAGQLDIT